MGSYGSVITSAYQFPFGSLLSFHRPGKLLVLTPDDCVSLGVPLADLSEHLLHVRLPNTSRNFENGMCERERERERNRDREAERQTVTDTGKDRRAGRD